MTYKSNIITVLIIVILTVFINIQLSYAREIKYECFADWQTTKEPQHNLTLDQAKQFLKSNGNVGNWPVCFIE